MAQAKYLSFINNKGDGGAIYNGGIITVTDCVFKDNKGVVASAFWNCGIATVVNSLFILNEHISGNNVYDRSGTISNSLIVGTERENVYLTLINSSIADNKTDDDGLYNDANATLYNNIIWNNGNGANDVYTSANGITVAEYNLIGTSNIDLTGNNNIIGIEDDPLFADAANGDYSLLENSPAIDAGNINLTGLEGLTALTDLSGNPRISSSAVDMGAYEFQQISASDESISADTDKIPVAYYNILGVQLNTAPQNGVYIVVYNNGSAEKRVR